uniref:Uncharacterized protein n=1 Tax=Rhodnius prolixus TaxID=13249 RepID=T1I531_RHOPR
MADLIAALSASCPWACILSAVTALTLELVVLC